MDEPSQSPPLERERDRAVQAICQRFSDDRIDLQHLEEMLDRVYQVQTTEELRALVGSLPAPEPVTPATVESGTRPAERDFERAGVRKHVLALMGGSAHRGAWRPARRVNVVALMGGIELDFREADLQPGITEVYVLSVMGGVDVIVPPDLYVDCDGIGIMGGFDSQSTGRPPADPSTPSLRLRGLGVMGAVEIVERLPGESSGDARRRRKLERKQRRLRG